MSDDRGGAFESLSTGAARQVFRRIVALGIGAFNKVHVTKALQASPTRGRQLLARTLSVDVLPFAAALALVGWATTMTGPPEM